MWGRVAMLDSVPHLVYVWDFRMEYQRRLHFKTHILMGSQEGFLPTHMFLVNLARDPLGPVSENQSKL